MTSAQRIEYIKADIEYQEERKKKLIRNIKRNYATIKGIEFRIRTKKEILGCVTKGQRIE